MLHFVFGTVSRSIRDRISLLYYITCVRGLVWWMDVRCLLHKIIIYQNYSAHFVLQEKMSIKLIFRKRCKTCDTNWEPNWIETRIFIAPEAILDSFYYYYDDGSEYRIFSIASEASLSIEVHTTVGNWSVLTVQIFDYTIFSVTWNSSILLNFRRIVVCEARILKK